MSASAKDDGQMVQHLLKAAHDLGGRTFRVVVQGNDKEGRKTILAGVEQLHRVVVEYDGEDAKAQAAIQRWLREGEWNGPPPKRITLHRSDRCFLCGKSWTPTHQCGRAS